MLQTVPFTKKRFNIKESYISFYWYRTYNYVRIMLSWCGVCHHSFSVKDLLTTIADQHCNLFQHMTFSTTVVVSVMGGVFLIFFLSKSNFALMANSKMYNWFNWNSKWIFFSASTKMWISLYTCINMSIVYMVIIYLSTYLSVHLSIQALYAIHSNCC